MPHPATFKYSPSSRSTHRCSFSLGTFRDPAAFPRFFARERIVDDCVIVQSAKAQCDALSGEVALHIGEHFFELLVLPVGHGS